MRIPLYAQNRHILVIDGIPVTGFAEGDFLNVKVDGNAAQRTQGADGPGMNVSTAQGGQITASLLPTSPALGTLYELYEAQRQNPRLFNVTLLTGVQELIQASQCAFGDLPQFASGGPTMQQRQFIFECTKIELDKSEVEISFAA